MHLDGLTHTTRAKMTAINAGMTVLVVGAGPVGLLTTLRLARAGINVTCLEALQAIDDSPRAMAYHPVATKELERAGVLDDIRRRGGSSGSGICWRSTKSGEVIAQLERNINKDFPYENLVIGQHELAAIILQHLRDYQTAKVLFGKKVTAIGQSSGDNVSVTVTDDQNVESVMSATYLVAADGGRSTIRRLLDISFDGFTYPEQLVSTNVYFPFDKHGWQDGNFCIDPEVIVAILSFGLNYALIFVRFCTVALGFDSTDQRSRPVASLVRRERRLITR